MLPQPPGVQDRPVHVGDLAGDEGQATVDDAGHVRREGGGRRRELQTELVESGEDRSVVHHRILPRGEGT